MPGGNLRTIRKRITSVRSTQQITRAMKMVSGAKFRRAEERVRTFLPYARELETTLGALAARRETLTHPLLEAGVDGAPPLFVVVGSDRGLCGAFNTNVFKQLRYTLEDRGIDPKDAVFYPIGRKSRDFIRRRGWTVLGALAPLPEPPTADVVAELAAALADAFRSGVVGEVHVVYNHFVNALVQKVQIEPLLPMPQATGTLTHVPHLTEPGAEALAQRLVPEVFASRLETILLDSLAGEHGARMTAMDSATKNASEMIGGLTLQYNRARQAAITSELLDIINGTNSID
jgi:F-type H+-transporting ATPase subunit gamma